MIVKTSIDSAELRKSLLWQMSYGPSGIGAEKLWLQAVVRQVAKTHNIDLPNWELSKITRDMWRAIRKLCEPPRVRQVGPAQRKRKSI